MSAISVSGLTVYHDNTPALWDLNFSIPKGQLVGILGPNGAGKSTLLKALLGEKGAISGTCELFSNRIAYVPQRCGIDWNFPITAYEVVLMGCYRELGFFKWPKKVHRKRAMELLDELGMADYARKQISELSGGQQQRLFIARALMAEADIFFFDEPFAAIDVTTETLLIDLMKRLKDEGKTLLVVHHDLSTAPDYFDWLIMLNLRLIASGDCQTVFCEENLKKAFGNKETLLEKAISLSHRVNEGLAR